MIGTLLRDAAKYLVALLVPAVVEIARVPIVTHLLGPADYGRYILIVAAVMLLAIVSVAWLSAALVRFLPRATTPDSSRRLTGTAFRALCGAVLLLVAAGAIAIALVGDRLPVEPVAAYLGLLYFAILSFERLYLSILRGRRLIGRYVFYTAVQATAGLALGVVLVIGAGLGVAGLLLGLALASGLLLPVAWWFTPRPQGSPESPARPKTAAPGLPSLPDLWAYGLPIAGINALTWLMSASDRYVLEVFRGSAEVGIYTASYTLAEKTIFLFTYVLSLAATPLAFNVWEQRGLGDSRAFMTQLTRLYLILALPATAGLAVLAGPLTGLLLPDAYRGGAFVIPLVAVGALALGLANVYTEAFTLRTRSGPLFLIYLLAGAVNLALNLVLVPAYGYPAAALSTLAAYGLFLGVTVVGARRTFPWPFPAATLARVLVGTAGIVIVVGAGAAWAPATTWPVIAGLVGTGVLVYAALLFGLGELRPAERRFLVEYLTGPRAKSPL